MVDTTVVTVTSVDVPILAVASARVIGPIDSSHTPTALVNATRPTTSPLNYHAWQQGLNSHPDREYVNNVLHDILYGVNIGYTGPRSFRVNKN
jgi:hypothetical protein